MTSRDNEGWDNGAGDKGGHTFDGWSRSQSLGVDFSFTPIVRMRIMLMLVVDMVSAVVVLMVPMVFWWRESLWDDTCWCNGARVTPISTNTKYRRMGNQGCRQMISADEDFFAEQDVEHLQGTCRPFPLWAASCQRASPASSAFPVCLDDTAETANSPHQLGKLLKY